MGYDNVSGSQSGRTGSLIETLECRRMLSSSYTVTDLGPVAAPGNFPGQSANQAFPAPMGLNGAGQVVAIQPGVRWYSPALFANGQVTPLASLARSFFDAQPYAMNDAGAIVGTFPGPRTTTERVPSYGFTLFPPPPTYQLVHLPDAFVYDGRRFRDIGPGTATGINQSGEVVGLGEHGGAFLYSNGRRHPLNPPHVRLKDITAVAINDAGDVVVTAAGRLYFYAHDSRKAVPFGGPTPFYVIAINDAGQVAGTVAGSASDAEVITQSSTSDLGPGQFLVHGMNASGEVVGHEYFATDQSSRAVVSQNGSWIDLNTLVPPAETGWTLRYAEAVNDAGRIAVIATNGVDVPHYLLLTPM